MPGIRAKVAPLISRATSYPPDARDAARGARNSGIRNAEEIARGFENLNSSVNQLFAAARAGSGAIEEFIVTDGVTGRVIAALGQYEVGGIVTSGGYFSELYAGDPYGDSDPAHAILKVTTDGKVQIGQNGWVDVLDPYGADAAWLGTQFDVIGVTGAANNGSGLIRLTVDEDVLVTGDSVRVLDVGGVPNATGIFTVTRINATHVDLQNSVFVGTYTSGGSVDRLLHITGAANNGAGLIRLTRAAHGYESGDKVNVRSVGGVPNATGQWIVEVISSSTFDLVASTFAGAYTTGGTSLRYFAGGLFQTIAIGPSFEDYRLRAFANGDLRIRNAEIILTGTGGTIVLDPSQGSITVTDAGGGDQIVLQSGKITLQVVDVDGVVVPDTSSGTLEPGLWQSFNEGLTSETASRVIDVYGYTGSSGYGPLLSLSQLRGTSSAATATQSGDTIGGMIGWGYDGTGESQYPVGLRMLAAENHAVGSHGTKIIFEVTPDGSTVAFTPVTIDQSGQILCDFGASPADSQLRLRANASGALAAICESADNSALSFDADYEAGAWIARNGSVVLISKSGALLKFFGSTGNASGSAATLTTRGTMNPATGFWRFGDSATAAYSVEASGDINATGVFRKGGTAGISVSRSFGTSLTVNSAGNGVFGTPGAGQANGTVVTGVTLNLTGNTFSGGILTV